jgi:glycosidase
MQWSAESNGGFTAGTVWESLQPDWKTKNVAAQDRDPASLLNHYRRLIHLRNEHSALGTGALAVGTASDTAVAAFIRRSPAETVIVIANFGARVVPQVNVTLDSGNGAPLRGRLERIYEDPANGCAPEAAIRANTSVSLGRIAPYGLCVFRLAAG